MKDRAPTPYHVGPHYKSDIESSQGRVAECLPFGSPRAEGSAAFIVRACNAYDDLLAALKAVQFKGQRGKCPECFGWDVSPNGETPGVHTKDCIVAKAIARAEGR